MPLEVGENQHIINCLFNQPHQGKIELTVLAVGADNHTNTNFCNAPLCHFV